MIRYKIVSPKNNDDGCDRTVDIYLEKDKDCGINLIVGTWYVANLTTNGKLKLWPDIPNSNYDGLKVDGCGQIIVEKC